MGVIRGAICAENTKNSISNKAVELVKEILTQNNLRATDVDAIIFSATNDLNACHPATAVREQFLMNNVAFMCLTEMAVRVSLDHCLRVSVFAPSVAQSKCKHCYLGRARVLREDFSN